MDNLNDRKKAILDKIAQMHVQLTEKQDTEKSIEAIKTYVQGMSDTAYKALPSGLKTAIGKIKGK